MALAIYLDMRLIKFFDLQTHAFAKRLYDKLTTADVELCVAFIKQHDALSQSEFELAVNRMFLDREKCKNWKIISELLSIANAQAHSL